MAPMGERETAHREGGVCSGEALGCGCLCTPAFPSFHWVLHCLAISSLPALVCLSCFLSFASKEPRPGAEGERGKVSATEATVNTSLECVRPCAGTTPPLAPTATPRGRSADASGLASAVREKVRSNSAVNKPEVISGTKGWRCLLSIKHLVARCSTFLMSKTAAPALQAARWRINRKGTLDGCVPAISSERLHGTARNSWGGLRPRTPSCKGTWELQSLLRAPCAQLESLWLLKKRGLGKLPVIREKKQGSER